MAVPAGDCEYPAVQALGALGLEFADNLDV